MSGYRITDIYVIVSSLFGVKDMVTTIQYVVVLKQQFLLGVCELVSGDLMHFNNKFYLILKKLGVGEEQLGTVD